MLNKIGKSSAGKPEFPETNRDFPGSIFSGTDISRETRIPI